MRHRYNDSGKSQSRGLVSGDMLEIITGEKGWYKWKTGVSIGS